MVRPKVDDDGINGFEIDSPTTMISAINEMKESQERSADLAMVGGKSPKILPPIVSMNEKKGGPMTDLGNTLEQANADTKTGPVPTPKPIRGGRKKRKTKKRKKVRRKKRKTKRRNKTRKSKKKRRRKTKRKRKRMGGGTTCRSCTKNIFKGLF